MKIVNGDESEIVITPEEFKSFWQKVNEFTSSSMSGVHYGHYKAAIQDDTISAALALQLTVVARSGIPPESWSVGLQVMLEKIAGVCLVEKLRAIQLYEADFNCYNQFIFGRHAMQTLTESGHIPEELFSQKGSTAEDAKFDDIDGRSLQTSATSDDCHLSRRCLLLRPGESRDNVPSLSRPYKRQHSSHSSDTAMPPDDENFPTNGIWRI